jgi:hypothetical protein
LLDFVLTMIHDGLASEPTMREESILRSL